MKIFSLNKKTEFFVLIFLTFFAFVFWDSFLIYPIKIFSVLIHESFHAFTALLTGGKISSIEIGFNLGGETETQFGNNFLIAISGYLGSLFVGILFFILSEKDVLFKYFVYSLSLILIIVLANSNPNSQFIIISLIVVLFLITCSIFINNYLVKLLMKFFGLISMLYVFIDLKNDLFNDYYESDAKILADIFNINIYIISFTWILLTSLLIYFTIKKVYGRIF